VITGPCGCFLRIQIYDYFLELQRNKELFFVFYVFFLLSLIDKKGVSGGIERTGKNITDRIREPPDNGEFITDHQASFFEDVFPLCPAAGST
jgi:hypothetical protein